MNCLLLTPGEVAQNGEVRLSGERARHIRKVLKVVPGQRLRAGILDGALGAAEVSAIEGDEVLLKWAAQESVPDPPPVDLILALPRPKVMRRLWASLASMGVGRIVLVNAEKVERHYFDTHWLQEETYRPRLVEGLSQCGDTRVPIVDIKRRLKPFVEDELDQWFPRSSRLITHPRAAHDLLDVPVESSQRVLLAIGPEGGWSDFEQELFAGRGFLPVHLGRRVLRSDTACIALLAVAHARLRHGL